MTEWYEKLLAVVLEGRIKAEEEMKKHTSFRVGGPAACFVSPGNENELQEVLAVCRLERIPFFILGNGSNLLVGDRGFDGVVISMDRFSACEVELAAGSAGMPATDSSPLPPEFAPCTIRAGAGVPLARIAREACAASLTGFEFAAGIPGSLGGAVVMNAGAYGSEMKDVLLSVRVLTAEGEVKELPASALSLGYRTSGVLSGGYVVLSAVIGLQTGSQEAIKGRMEELAARRREKQPLEYPSAGSTFKRPQGHFAGKLIEDAGLRGFSVGGAQVSEKHCGFVINKDRAAAADILKLCKLVKEKVLIHSGVELEMEVKILGKF